MRITRRNTIVGSLVVLATLAPARTEALTYVAVSDQNLVDRADAIIRGSVVAHWVADETGPVMTSYEFDVLQVLKGESPGSRLLVRVPGGIDSDKQLAVKVFGTPSFATGARSLEPRTSAASAGRAVKARATASTTATASVP